MNLFQSLDFYCERLGPFFWSEPINAISNLAFILAGVYGISIGQKNFWVVLLSVEAIMIGIGSFLFHTFANVWSNLTDVIPIQIFILTFLFVLLLKGMNRTVVHSWIGVIGFALIFYLIKSNVPVYLLNGSVAYLPPIITLLFLSRWVLYRRYIWIACGIFFVSLVARTMDNFICPMFPWGTHFIWHILNGVMLFVLIKWTNKVIHQN